LTAGSNGAGTAAGGAITITSGDAGSGSTAAGGNITLTIGQSYQTNVGTATGKVTIAAGTKAGSHLASTQSTAPVVTNTGGSSISCTSCTDMRGKVAVTTAANTNAIVVTFDKAYGSAPVCTVSPTNLNAAVDFASGTIAPAITTSTTALTITPGANWAANAKTLSYICIE
jgi:hypothetical protein